MAERVEAVVARLVEDREFEEVHAGIPVPLMRRRFVALGCDWEALATDCAKMPQLEVVTYDTSAVAAVGIRVTWPDGKSDEVSVEPLASSADLSGESMMKKVDFLGLTTNESG